MNDMKPKLEELSKEERFSGKKMYQLTTSILTKEQSTSALLASIRRKLGELDYEYTIISLLRNVFFIELVNDDISSTKMEVRWVTKKKAGKKQEAFDESDPRFCSFDGCMTTLLKLLRDLDTSVEREEIRNLLRLYQQYSLLAYEIPLDYLNSPVSDKSISRIHSPENIQWISDERYQRTLRLREALLDPKKNSRSELFSKILTAKIQVKTYLTDRVQTGAHMTDREKRWEAHPESVHFAFRRQCLEIERRLISQLCYFEGFSEDLFTKLKAANLIDDLGQHYRCPVTQNVLSFAEFEKEIMNPIHGKSRFHVGHLTPLKSITDDPEAGHTVNNIGWFSDDGNRIQGSLSLSETRALLGQIIKNYKEANIKLGGGNS